MEVQSPLPTNSVACQLQHENRRILPRVTLCDEGQEHYLEPAVFVLGDS